MHALLCIGCSPKKEVATEVSFAEQLKAVTSGAADEIRLEHTAVQSRELKQLEGLKTLRALVLDAGVVRDEDVQQLTSLSGLEHLRLRESPLTDAGIAQLSRLESLLILNLPQAKPTAVGLKSLAALPKLRQLRSLAARSMMRPSKIYRAGQR